MIEVASKNALISALVHSEKDIAILVGSPLSMPDKEGVPGVPGVPGVLRLIEQHITTKGLNEDFEKEVGEASGAEQYQRAFSFLRSWTSQSAVNSIVKDAVLKARKDSSNNSMSHEELDKDLDGWYLPQGVKSLGKILAATNKFNGPVITTNFDPLVAVSINCAGGRSLQSFFDTDGSLDQIQSLDSELRHVAHLHGYWHGSDTLHTPSQLSSPRPSLKASLENILSERLLLVIGYGGWDDVFHEALCSIVNNSKADLDILWAFYDADPLKIEKNYSSLIGNLGSGISRGRFRLYGGIDCNSFFSELEERFLENRISLDETLNSDASKPISEAEIEFSEDFVTGESGISIDDLKLWDFTPNHTHEKIRAAERYQFSSALDDDRAAFLCSNWGLGEYSFIHSICEDDKSSLYEKRIFNVDIDGCVTGDDIYAEIERQLGSDIKIFVMIASQESDMVLILNGVTETAEKKDGWFEALDNIYSIITDLSEDMKLIFIGRKENSKFEMQSISLGPLVDADIRSYIKYHENGGEEYAYGENYEILSRLSSGIPLQLDKLLSDLSVVSIDELVDNESETATGLVGSEDDSMPTELIRAVNVVKKRGLNNDDRSFKLLKVLSVFPAGEIFKNIRRFNNSYPFHLKHLKELQNMGLLETSLLTSDSLDGVDPELSKEKIHTVQPLVRKYVLDHMSPDEVYELTLRAADITFGTGWKQGEIKLNRISKLILTSLAGNGVGNPHSIAINLIRKALENDDQSNLKKAYEIAVLYCEQLRSNDRHRDAVRCCNDLLMHIKDCPDIDLTRLNVVLGRSLRMIKKHDESIKVLNDVVENGSPSNIQKKRIYIALALSYESKKCFTEAVESAKESQKYTKKKSSDYYLAEDIIVGCSEKGKDERLQELRSLYTKIKDKKSSAANNVLLKIANAEKQDDRKIKLLDDVVRSSSNAYNRYRAIVKKGEILVGQRDVSKIHRNDLIEFCKAYGYGFSQRNLFIFNKANEFLWEYFEASGNFYSLLKIFRLSSLTWRFEGKVEEEEYYSTRLQTALRRVDHKSFFDHKRLGSLNYSLMRMKLLSDRKEKLS
ncbi:SIR2 family protein [Neptuniibacter sp. QD34_54]|uniref:SIR2 family protein n=1 Tax=Neptuniibacter sp. QD34_54 TaxID=3398208 RepID=UPI0039F55754